jgi:Xylose isomerase-like TIM barrel/PhoU domain
LGWRGATFCEQTLFEGAREFAEGLGEAFDAHEKLHMVMHSQFLFFGHPMVTHTKATGLEDQIGWVHATLEKVIERAASIGCVIVIENIRDTNPLLELVASFNSESVRMSLDVGHANLMQAIGGPTPDAWVRAAGNLLGHAHLQDNDAMNDYHWPAGQGSINWQTLLLAIKNLETMRDLDTGLRDENANLASSVADRDNDVDLLTALLNESLLERQHSNQNDLVASLRVVGGLQRIGDYLENVAERMVFWINGPQRH